MKFTKIKIIHKNKNEIHKKRTLDKKPGLTPGLDYIFLVLIVQRSTGKKET